VARRAWGWPDIDLPPITDLVATAHVGGLVAGAFDGGEMVGFVSGMPRLGLGEPCHHSHMLAVVPEAQGRGLAARLKLFQRRFCLERGIRLVTWTYDPLLVKNAALNLNRLGAAAAVYVRDFYGPMGGIYHACPPIGSRSGGGSTRRPWCAPPAARRARFPTSMGCPASRAGACLRGLAGSRWRSPPGRRDSTPATRNPPCAHDWACAVPPRPYSAAGIAPRPSAPASRRPSTSSSAETAASLLTPLGDDAPATGWCR
jgi:GNAT superfamily N-acetyltransferase